MIHRPTALALTTLALLLLAAPSAQAAPPQLGPSWTSEVSAGSATFHGEVNPEGTATTYRFEYATDAAFEEKGFSGAAKAPATSSCPGSGCAGSKSSFEKVSQHISALKANTTYHYRLAATGEGTTTSDPLTFTTQGIGAAFALPDKRGWELVSPPDKNGGAIQGFEANHGGGVIQAAAETPAITYTSASSFGEAPQGAPQASQYISRRSGSGWATENITAPTLSGAYGNEPNGVPYQLFSTDLARALMLNGVHCRGEGSDCPVANPPLGGTEAPAGFQDYYLRDDEANSFQSTLAQADLAHSALSSSQFDLAFAGSSEDLRHPVLSTCAALTPEATEVPSGAGGCEEAEQNLYEWAEGTLHLINVLPGETQGSPGARLASQGAVSEDGSRAYFTELEDGALYLAEAGKETKLLPETSGGGASFQVATPNGAFAFFTKAGTLYRYDATAQSSQPLASGVQGVLGISEDGSRAYYATAAGISLWSSGTPTPVIATPEAAQASDYPPTTGTARVSADGARLLFLSKAPLSGYDNTDQATGQPDSEVFLYEASGAGSLTCLSCNPTGERPLGPSTIPGAIANGQAQGSTDLYKPRNLSATADRAFFDSEDALVALDTDKAQDAYQWEAQGTGTCAKPGGCLSLISSGTDAQGASFLDATESGEDAYFLSFSSLVPSDPGSADVYDARVGGGFAIPTPPIPCEGDACQPLPNAPEDPTVGSLIGGPGNPPIHFPAVPCKKGSVRKNGKCVKKPSRQKKQGGKGGKG